MPLNPNQLSKPIHIYLFDMQCPIPKTYYTIYNFSNALDPNILPPSKTIVSPLICPPALLLKNTTAAAISSARPTLPFGFALFSASIPPLFSISPFAIFEGKKPGAIPLTRIPLGPSSMARLRARWRTAALLAAYEYAALGPREPMPMPATEPVTMTREGSAWVAFFWRRGANLWCLVSSLHPILRFLAFSSELP